MKQLLFLSISLGLFTLSCSDNSNSPKEVDSRSRAQIIIDSAIAFHGGEKYHNSEIAFGYSGKMYRVDRSANTFTYSVQFSDSLGNHYRELTNIGFTESIDNKPILLSAKDSMAFAASLNSVIYFALLPSFLQDGSVNSSLDGEDEIEGKAYYRIKVTFNEEGTGAHFEEIYLYWFDKADFSMDYLAYSFRVNNGGSRFRVATHP